MRRRISKADHLRSPDLAKQLAKRTVRDGEDHFSDLPDPAELRDEYSGAYEPARLQSLKLERERFAMQPHVSPNGLDPVPQAGCLAADHAQQAEVGDPPRFRKAQTEIVHTRFACREFEKLRDPRDGDI